MLVLVVFLCCLGSGLCCSDFDLFLKENELTLEDMEISLSNEDVVASPSLAREQEVVEVGISTIDGQGVFAKKEIGPGAQVCVGVTPLGWRTIWARYMNHQEKSKANCKMRHVPSGEYIFESTRFIRPGEELTVDYRQVEEMRAHFANQ